MFARFRQWRRERILAKVFRPATCRAGRRRKVAGSAGVAGSPPDQRGPMIGARCSRGPSGACPTSESTLTRRTRSGKVGELPRRQDPPAEDGVTAGACFLRTQQGALISQCQRLFVISGNFFVNCWGHFSDFVGEFDPGSGRTLAACLTHASRATASLRGCTERRTGE